MRKLVLLLVISLFATGLFAATIVGTKHDLSLTNGQPTVGHTNTGEVCVFCHTPHDAIGATNEDPPLTKQLIPLWNHTATVAVYTMYTGTNPGSSLQGVVDAAPGGTSKVCLSCHDGSIAVGALNNLPNDIVSMTYTAGTGTTGIDAAGIIKTTSNAYMGTDLTNDHPISITYVAADTGLNNPTLPAFSPMVLYAASGAVSNVYGSKVECGSCHSVHNFVAATAFLRLANTGSAMCLKCHAK